MRLLTLLVTNLLPLTTTIAAALPVQESPTTPSAPTNTTLTTTSDCNPDCKCLGNRKVAQLYCGYCEDVYPNTGQTISGENMNRCEPDGSCCDLGWSQTCRDTQSNEWCGHAL